MTVDRTGRGYQLGHDEREYRVWPSGGPPSAGRAFPNTAEGWQQAWKEFEVLEANLPPAPPPPVRTRKPGRARRRKRVLLTVGILVVAIAGLVGLVQLVGAGPGKSGGRVLLTEDFSEAVSGSGDIDQIEYVDGTLHVTPTGGESEATVTLSACESPFIGLCDTGKAALRVSADVQLSGQRGSEAAVGIGCANRDSDIGYAFVLAATNPPQFVVYADGDALATAVAPAGFPIDRRHRFEVQCLSGSGGSGTTLVLDVDGDEVIRATDTSRDHTFFDAMALVVVGAGTVGVFDNAVIQEP